MNLAEQIQTKNITNVHDLLKLLRKVKQEPCLSLSDAALIIDLFLGEPHNDKKLPFLKEPSKEIFTGYSISGPYEDEIESVRRIESGIFTFTLRFGNWLDVTSNKTQKDLRKITWDNQGEIDFNSLGRPENNTYRAPKYL